MLKKIVFYLFLVLLILIFGYLIYPKSTVRYSPARGSWVPFGATVSVSKCYGFSKGITNKWLEEYRRTNGNPGFVLREKDYCIGTFFPFGYGVITDKGVELEFFK